MKTEIKSGAILDVQVFQEGSRFVVAVNGRRLDGRKEQVGHLTCRDCSTTTAGIILGAVVGAPMQPDDEIALVKKQRRRSEGRDEAQQLVCKALARLGEGATTSDVERSTKLHKWVVRRILGEMCLKGDVVKQSGNPCYWRLREGG